MKSDIIAFTRGVPPAESFPLEALITCAEHVIHSDGARILQYGSGAGYHPLRDQIAKQFQVHTDRVMIGQGSLQLLDHLCRVVLKPGDRVFIEQPSYDRTITLFKRAGAELIGFHLKDGQIDMDAIKDALAHGPAPRFFYLIPDFQNPGGSTMSLSDRRELITLSQYYGFTIIEDSPYRLLRYIGEEIPSLFELSPDDVIQMSSFSKLISPGLRTGFMILNNGIADDIIRFATDTYISPSMFDQALVLEYLHMGLLDDHINFLKSLFYPRLQALLNTLAISLSDFGVWTKPQGGYFVGFFVNQHIRTPELDHAGEFGLALTDGTGFFIDDYKYFLRLPFCALTEDTIIEGVHRLRNFLDS
jgi:DNA-binding transcriptional MocR family regulator